MFCKFCGKEIADDAVVCVHCGRAVKPQQEEEKSNPAKTLAILGFVFSFLFALVGLILSIIALNKYKKQEDQSCKGLATAGLIISIVSMALVVIVYIYVFSIAGAYANAISSLL